jgi:hypothetical protein
LAQLTSRRYETFTAAAPGSIQTVNPPMKVKKLNRPFRATKKFARWPIGTTPFIPDSLSFSALRNGD